MVFYSICYFMVVFGWGWHIYHQMRHFPDNALEIHVLAQKWNWTFQYKSGKNSLKDLVVPVNTPVKLILSSKDVIHSFYVPSMRIKQDAVPGRYTALWFESKHLGDFQVFCAEFCGDQHSAMFAKIKVVTMEEYEKWLKETDSGLSLAQRGEKVYKSVCIACHSLDGSRTVGPSWKGLFGSKREFENGSTTIADEDYLKESILNPNVKVVKSYPPVMPSYQGQFSEEQISGIVEYIKDLK